MSLISTLTSFLPSALRPSGATLKRPTRLPQPPACTPEWYAQEARQAYFLHTGVANGRTALALRGAGGGAPDAGVDDLGFNAQSVAPGLLQGRTPAHNGEAMMAWSQVVAAERIGLVIELGDSAEQGQSQPGLTERPVPLRVTDSGGREVARTQVWNTPQRTSTQLPDGAKTSTLRVLSTLGNERPQAREVLHLRLGDLYKGALSPEDTMKTVDFIECSRLARPDVGIMTLDSTGCGASAQLAIARQLYAAHRAGQLTPHNLSRKIGELCEQLTLQRRAAAPSGHEMVASLLVFGHQLLQRPVTRLVAERRELPPALAPVARRRPNDPLPARPRPPATTLAAPLVGTRRHIAALFKAKGSSTSTSPDVPPAA